MDFKQIQELIKLINKSNIGEVTIEEKGFRITVKQKEEHIQQVISAPALQAQPVVHTIAAPVTQNVQPATSPEAGRQKSSEPAPAADNYISIKSPMIGTFYRSSAPDKPPFVNVGDDITPGKAVCI